MKRSTAWDHDLPLFADPPDVWETLDEATRQQVLERLARLLLAHGKAVAGRSIPSLHPNPKRR
jgi:hypothetical protein